MRALLLVIFMVGFLSFGQEIKPLFPGISFAVNPEEDALSTSVYEDCYCYPVYKKGTDSITSLKPIVYPLPVKKNGLWGLINQKGTKVVDFKSEKPFLWTEKGKVILKNFKQENYFWKTTADSKLSLLDSAGNEKEMFYVASTYKGAYAVSEDSLNWGMLNSKMDTLVALEYIPSHHSGEQFDFSEHGYLVLRENKSGGLNGVVDYKGRIIIPFKWLLLSYKITNLDYIYAVNDYKKRGYINIKGQTTMPFKYDMVPREITDSNEFRTEDYIWFTDKDFKQIGPKYQAFERKGDLWFFKVNGKWGVKDLNYKNIIPPIYNSIMDGPRIKDNPDFKCYIVEKNGLYGLVKLDGTVIIKPAYECLCGLSYYAPEGYYIEFKKGDVSYKFSKTGELVEKGGKSGGMCFCE